MRNWLPLTKRHPRMNTGDKAIIKVRAVDPLTLEVIKDAVGVAYLFAPPKNPSTSPSDRTPDYTVPLVFDPL